MKIKVSKYTFEFVSSKQSYFIYNSQTNILIKVNKKIYEVIHKSKATNDSSLLLKFNDSIINKFKELKIIVDWDENEKYLLDLEMNYMIKSFSNNRIVLVIAPTTACNFGCDYCFEKDKKNIKMSDETIDNLIAFLKEFKFSNSLHLTWYGGEPLLATPIIKKILNRIKNELSHLKMEYQLLITNGYYLNQKHISIFDDFPLNEIQVTLDGNKSRHDKLRCLKHSKKGTYDRILSNVDEYTTKHPETLVSIRLNIDRKNSSSFNEQRVMLNQRWKGKNVLVYPGILRIEDEKNNCMACEAMSHDDIREIYYDIGEEVDFYPKLKGKGCCATHVNSFVIGPEGEMYKCWNDVSDKNKIIGYIHKKELTNKDLFNRYILSTSCFRNTECRDCFFLPICVGGCAYYRLKNIFEEGKYDLCSLYNKEGVLQKCLELHYDIKHKKTQNAL